MRCPGVRKGKFEKDTPTTPVFGDTWSKNYLVNYRREALQERALNNLVGRATDLFVKDYLRAAQEDEKHEKEVTPR